MILDMMEISTIIHFIREIESRMNMILKNAVESTTNGYCTDSLNDFDDLLLHRMADTPSAKNRQNLALASISSTSSRAQRGISTMGREIPRCARDDVLGTAVEVQNLSKNQHMNHSRDDSTAFCRMIRLLFALLTLMIFILSHVAEAKSWHN